MHARLKKLASVAGVDRAIAFSVGSRGIGFVFQPITIFMIAAFLSETEMGYYYTFYDVLNISFFFNLGLTTVLQVFASHEKAKLKWLDGGRLTGDQTALMRLQSILNLGLKWFGAAAVLMMILVYPAGIMFFHAKGVGDSSIWMAPWFCASLVTAGSLVVGAILSVLEGCGRIKELRLLQMLHSLVSSPVMWVVLILGGGLFAGPALFGTVLVVSLVWLWKTHSGFLMQNVTLKSQTALKWREMWPLQWRFALSWSSGYLVQHLMTPMAFAFIGTTEAGKLGMALVLAQQAGSVGMLWITTKLPRMGELWAKKEFSLLENLLGGAVWRMLVVSVLVCGGVLLLVELLAFLNFSIADRLLAPSILYKIMLIQILKNIMNSEVMYLRMNKQDPLVWVSMIYGFSILICNWVLARHYGLDAMVQGYLFVSIAACLVHTGVFSHRRHKWQRACVSA